MAATHIQRSGVVAAPEVTRALAAIADHARRRQYAAGAKGCKEPLLSWERVAQFDAFRITVRCDYNLGQEPAQERHRGVELS